jgi:outer membrane protein TolC
MRYLLITACWLAGSLTQAQTPRTFTLEQCIEYALQNAIAVKNATLDEEIAKARVKETIGIGLPQVSGSLGVQYNERIRRLFVPYTGPGGFFDFSGVPGIAVGDVVGLANPFVLKSAGEAGLTINQILFNGSYLVGLQAANAYKALSVKAAGQTREQTIVNVSKAYYLAITNQERIKLFDTNIARVDTLLRNTQALFQNGFAEQIDVDRVRVSFNNLQTEREKFRNIQIITKEVLKFQMNYPMNEDIEVLGAIGEFALPGFDEYADGVTYRSRWDYQLLQANKRLQELDLKNKYAAGVPSLVAFANIGYNTADNRIGDVFRTRGAVVDDGLIGPDRWYGFSLFGVTLNVPIFSGLQRTYQVQQSRMNLLKVENSARQLESAIDLEARQARVSLENAIQTVRAQQENMELAANVARVTKVKYEQGLGSSLEVINAEAGLREAQINYYNALYDALVAKVDIDKAYGRLNPATPNQN